MSKVSKKTAKVNSAKDKLINTVSTLFTQRNAFLLPPSTRSELIGLVNNAISEETAYLQSEVSRLNQELQVSDESYDLAYDEGYEAGRDESSKEITQLKEKLDNLRNCVFFSMKGYVINDYMAGYKSAMESVLSFLDELEKEANEQTS